MQTSYKYFFSKTMHIFKTKRLRLSFRRSSFHPEWWESTCKTHRRIIQSMLDPTKKRLMLDPTKKKVKFNLLCLKHCKQKWYVTQKKHFWHISITHPDLHEPKLLLPIANSLPECLFHLIAYFPEVGYTNTMITTNVHAKSRILYISLQTALQSYRLFKTSRHPFTNGLIF